MAATLHLMGADYFADAAVGAQVLDCAKATLADLEGRAPLAPLDVVLFPTPNLMDPRWCRSGICHSAFAVECCFNPDHPRFAAEYETELPRVLIHECHHALRMRQVDHWTLGENLVLEGLALAAEAECGLPSEGFPPLPSAVTTELAKRALDRWDTPMGPEEDIDSYGWIWESHSPQHVSNMYYVGRELVGGALASSGEDAFSALSKPNSWFRETAQTA